LPKYILKIILELSIIFTMLRDTHNGKYDITFKTKKDGLMRGLQIKTLGKRKGNINLIVNLY
jgi:hypothetical protein